MTYYALYNPFSGSGDAKEKVELLVSHYENEVRVQSITDIQDYASFFRAMNPEDAVIICGGDGTLNRFINDTEGLTIENDILYYAVGTGNDFLRDLGKDAGAEPFSVKEYIRNLPVVTVNGSTHRFLNNVGFGIDGYCCEIGDAQKAKGLTDINYTAIAIKGLLFHYKTTSATVTVDGESFRYENVWLAPTMKGRFYGGGMMPTPKQDRNDPEGKISIMIYHAKSKLRALTVFPSLFKGEHVQKDRMVAIHSGKDISVVFDRPTALQIDGETILGVTEYRANAHTRVKETVLL